MIRNYLKTGIRNLSKNKGYAIINILGLAIGIAACILIFVVIRFETSFDTFHTKKDHIYRVSSEFHGQDGVDYSAGVSFPVAPALRIDFPQIKQVGNIFRRGDVQIIAGTGDETHQRKFHEDNFFYAEPEFFKMFDFAWLAGSPDASLKLPDHVVITQEFAEKYFGTWQAAMGQTIKLNNQYVYKVSGILKNVPVNTDFPLNAVASFSSLMNTNMKRNMNDWVSTMSEAYTFVVLPSGYSLPKFNQELRAFAKRHRPAEYSGDGLIAQPLNDIHYDERFGNFRSHTFSKSLIRALILIGIFLLVIACVNFVNLATAQAVNRSREVGVRKVLGSTRKQLAIQFLGETTMITLTSVLLAIVIATLALPFLNTLLQLKMSQNIFSDVFMIVFLVALIIAVSFLSGLYPAVILSGFSPITALKSKVTSKMMGGITLRRVLVVFQFAIAHVLIIGTIIVVSQMNFFRNASLGFEKAEIVNVPIPGDSISRTHLDYMRDQLAANKDISSFSFSFASPSADGNWSSDFKFDHSSKSTQFGANLKWADVNYFKTYNIQFLAGRPYFPSDTVREFVVNETLLHKVGVTKPEDAIGKELNFWDGVKKGPIVGVIKDFNAYSLREPMAPVVLSTWKDVYETINIKIKPGKIRPVLSYVEALWNKTFPDYVYQSQFLDDTINNFYRQENQLSQLYKIFAALAILISCLGLYGLVSFTAVQRTKELGIRKILGASVSNIVYLLSKEFTILILLAFLIGGPVAWYFMHRWLENYTYRIAITFPVFLMAIAGSIIIAWITVGHRAIRAALANPVKNLRTE